jgi:hypothetical protein
VKYNANPTWRMLEKGKIELSRLMTDIGNSMDRIPSFMRYEIEITLVSVQTQHNKLVKLQLELESKLCMGDM